MQGAATIHEMKPDEIKRLMSLEVKEVVEGGNADRLPFLVRYNVRGGKRWVGVKVRTSNQDSPLSDALHHLPGNT